MDRVIVRAAPSVYAIRDKWIVGRLFPLGRTLFCARGAHKVLADREREREGPGIRAILLIFSYELLLLLLLLPLYSIFTAVFHWRKSSACNYIIWLLNFKMLYMVSF